MKSFRLCFLAAASLVASSVLGCGDSTGPGGSGAAGGNGGSGAGESGGQGTGASGGGGGVAGGPIGGGGAGSGGSPEGGGGGGTGGAGSADPECTDANDCVLHSDCCECAGRPVGQTPPDCAQDCFVDSCTSFGITGVACVAGRCVTDASCNENTVTCDVPAPRCSAGTAPIVEGACYAGGCLDARECSAVTSCDVCAGVTNGTCVTDVAQLSDTHCVDLATCAAADCACLGPSVCVGSFSICNESPDGIDCDCPTCSF